MSRETDARRGDAPRFSLAQLPDLLAALVLIGVAVVAALTFEDYGLGWDDYTHAQYGDLLLKLYASGFTDRRAFGFVNLYMYGGGFDMLAALAAKILPFDLFATRRLVGAAVGLVGLAATWRIGRRIGGPTCGLIALVLLATCPLYYGHMFMNPKDAPFAAAMALLLLALVRAIEDYPRPTPATVALFAIGLGLTIGSRIIGGMAAIYAAAAVALIVAVEARALGVRAAGARAGRFIVALLPGLVIAYAVMALVWPWAVVDPLNPIRSLEYFSVFFEKPWKEMFGGQLIPVPEMPRSYVPTLFALKTPEVFLLLAGAGIVGAVIAAARPDTPLRRRAALVLLVVAAVLPIAIAVATRPAAYNGIRHFIFVTPPLAALGGLAGAWLLEWLSRYGRGAVAAAAAVLAAAVAVPVIESVRLHPYQYTYFNTIAGGVAAADERYMLDYWGLSFKEAGEALRARLAQEPARRSRRWTVAVCGPHPPARIALGDDFVLTWDSKGADFALMLGEFYCAQLDAPVLVEIEREGVVYARAYDIRGRSISSLFTIPPVR
ncbi:MAG TPA: glycosyltransferase family 39 protein [Xanthobacteraceae bacterium]|nr:glycosyltransferase family 39 protein [Xanthobacteraceae bacterium]